jgi:hypothetical protein
MEFFPEVCDPLGFKLTTGTGSWEYVELRIDSMFGRTTKGTATSLQQFVARTELLQSPTETSLRQAQPGTSVALHTMERSPNYLVALLLQVPATARPH